MVVVTGHTIIMISVVVLTEKTCNNLTDGECFGFIIYIFLLFSFWLIASTDALCAWLGLIDN